MTFRSLLWLASALFTTTFAIADSAPESSPVAIAIHGGAGTLAEKNFTPALEREYRDALTAALERGHRVLTQGGPSTEAVIAAVTYLEDSPLFNAGRGAVMTYEGEHRLDASIMEGADQQAGAVANVSSVKNPIEAAYAVMTRSPHVLLAGSAADGFAEEMGLTLVPNSYFTTPRRKASLEKLLKRMQQSKHGTVGAVALDSRGNLAAATSTGGMTGKRWGRIGDSPIIGAGTYAQNGICAVSATGHGEFFIRYTVTADICARVRYLGEPLKQAADTVIEQLAKAGGEGGIVALDGDGQPVFAFSTPGMYRGAIDTKGNLTVAIFKDR